MERQTAARVATGERRTGLCYVSGPFRFHLSVALGRTGLPISLRRYLRVQLRFRRNVAVAVHDLDVVALCNHRLLRLVAFLGLVALAGLGLLRLLAHQENAVPDALIAGSSGALSAVAPCWCGPEASPHEPLHA